MTELVTGKAFPNVVVTGVAMTTALAPDVETTWKLLLDSQSGIRILDDPFVEEFNLPVRIGGHLVEEFDSQMTRIELRRTGYLQRMSTVSRPGASTTAMLVSAAGTVDRRSSSGPHGEIDGQCCSQYVR